MVALLGALGLRRYARSVTFWGSAVPFPAADRLPAGVSVVEAPAADGTPLRAAWWRTGAPGARTVVYFHGNAESAAQNFWLASALAARGVDTLLPEYRGYGGIPGRPTEERVVEDARVSLEVLAGAGVPRERIVLVGRSLGSGVAVELATRADYPLVILVSPYTSLADVGRSAVGPLAPLLVPDRFDSLSKAARVRGPVAVLHGEEDRTIPFAMGERLSRAFPRGRLVPLAGRGHDDIPELAELIAAEIAREAPR